MKIAMTGASGRLGRSVAAALGSVVAPSTVTLGTRNPASLEAFSEQGFRTAVADFDRPDTLEAAFEGADVVYIICGDAENVTRIRQHRNAIDAARKVGAGRVVYTSFVNPTSASLFPFARVHEDTERYLRDSGLPYTLLRNNHFAENLSGALALAQDSGELALPGAHGKVAYISRSDVAAATAGALTQPGHENRCYEVCGPQPLDLFEVAGIAGRVWGRPVTGRDMGADEYRQLLERRGLPPYAVAAQVGIRLAAGAGEYAATSTDAAILARRPIGTVESFLRGLTQK